MEFKKMSDYENINIKEEIINSKSITIVDDDSYKLYKEPKSNIINNISYDINKNNENIKSQIELSSFTEKDSMNYLNNENKLNIPIIIKEKEEEKNKLDDNMILLYGNDINNIYPKYLGKMLSMIYVKNNPLIVIGPDCKLFLI